MKKSAGILLFKNLPDGIRFLLVHPGGPFWKNKDSGSWSIPKGEIDDNENPLDAAIREFQEETGALLAGSFIALHPVKLKSGKVVTAWALEHDFDVQSLKSNTFEMDWPPKSGRQITVPEVDRAAWFSEAEALEKINPAQGDLIRQVILNLQQS